MANIKQQKKRVRTAARERLENLRYRSTIKTLTKRLERAVEGGAADGDIGVELAGHSDDHLGTRHAGRFGSLLGEEREDHRNLYPGILPGERDLTGLEQWVHRHRDGSDSQDRVVDDREVDDVRHDHRYPITRFETTLAQGGREPRHGSVQSRIAEDRLALLDRW